MVEEKLWNILSMSMIIIIIIIVYVFLKDDFNDSEALHEIIMDLKELKYIKYKNNLSVILLFLGFLYTLL